MNINPSITYNTSGTAYKYVVVVYDDAGRGCGEEFPTVARARARIEQLRLLGFHDVEICSVPQGDA